MEKTINLQGQFLEQLQKERTQVTVFTVNGFQLKGTITGWDQFTIMVESGGTRQLVYKSAVSTVREGG